jgi:hypothetical protein
VIWCHTSTGRRMPMDAEPNGGAYRLTGEAVVYAHHEGPHEGGHGSHFATCPDADKHRRAR